MPTTPDVALVWSAGEAGVTFEFSPLSLHFPETGLLLASPP
jgi:hypothetical protein